MQQKETRPIPREELRELAQRCSDFIDQFAAWKHPVSLELSMKDVSFLACRLEEYKELMRRAKELKVVDPSHMPRGWWPGYEARINDERHLVATKLPYRAGEGKSSYRVKGEKYDIAPESLARFFQSAAGMIANKTREYPNSPLTIEEIVERASTRGIGGIHIG